MAASSNSIVIRNTAVRKQAMQEIQTNMRQKLVKFFDFVMKFDSERVFFILKGLNEIDKYPYKQIINQVKDRVGFTEKSWNPNELLRAMIVEAEDIKIKMLLTMLIISIVNAGFDKGTFSLPDFIPKEAQEQIISTIAGYYDFSCKFVRERQDQIEKLVKKPRVVKVPCRDQPDYTRPYIRPIGFHAKPINMTVETMKEFIRVNKLMTMFQDYLYNLGIVRVEKRHYIDFLEIHMPRFAYF